MVCMNVKLKYYWPAIVYFHPRDLLLKKPHSQSMASLFLLQPQPSSGPNSLCPLHLGKKKKPDFLILYGIPSMATGCDMNEISSQLGFYFTRSSLLFGHELLDLPLFFLLFNLGFFMNLLDGLWALVCSP